jgi:hypothetical protein
MLQRAATSAVSKNLKQTNPTQINHEINSQEFTAG